MTNAEFIEDKYANIRAWADMNHCDPVIGWDLHLTDLILDNVDPERDDVVEQVREFLDNLYDDPEMYGITFPVYTADAFDIYDRNTPEVEEIVDELGGMGTLVAGDGDITIEGLVYRAVVHYVDSAARYAVYELSQALDSLEEMFEDEE